MENKGQRGCSLVMPASAPASTKVAVKVPCCARASAFLCPVRRLTGRSRFLALGLKYSALASAVEDGWAQVGFALPFAFPF